MNKQLKRSLCALSLALFLLPQLPLSVPAEKAEEETEAPEIVYTNYTVSSVQDLQNLADTCRLDSASKTLRVTLTADLDLKDHENLMIPTFGGIFDGQNHKIYGIAVDSDGSARGLFRYIQEGATVKEP